MEWIKIRRVGDKKSLNESRNLLFKKNWKSLSSYYRRLQGNVNHDVGGIVFQSLEAKVV